MAPVLAMMNATHNELKNTYKGLIQPWLTNTKHVCCTTITVKKQSDRVQNVMLISDEIELDKMSRNRPTQFTIPATWPPAEHVPDFDKTLDNLHVMVGDTENEVNWMTKSRFVVSAAACPDTGASMSVCGPDLIKKLRANMADDQGKYRIR